MMTHCREEVEQLATWYNNLSLNVEKTKEMVVDFRKGCSVHPPLTINGTAVESVSSTKFLNCSTNPTALVKKTQQHLHLETKESKHHQQS